MPFRLHRSLIFWLGLLGAAFLWWAWLDSMRNYTEWIRLGHFSGSVVTATGALRCGASWDPVPEFWSYRRHPIGYASEWLRGFRLERANGLTCVWIPYWSLLGAYLLAWLPALFLRARKGRLPLTHSDP